MNIKIFIRLSFFSILPSLHSTRQQRCESTMLVPVLLLLLYANVVTAASDTEYFNFDKDCQQMECFTVHNCFKDKDRLGPQTYKLLMKFTKADDIEIDCDAILMLRRYTSRKWLVVLAARNQNITRIKTVHKTFDFTCQRFGKNKKVRAYYKDKALTDDELVAKNSAQLACEIHIDNDLKLEDLGENERMTIELYSLEFGSITPYKDLSMTGIANIKATCDPDVFETVSERKGPKISERLVPRRDRMKCRNSTIQPLFQREGSKVFEPAKAILCAEGLWVVQDEQGGEFSLTPSKTIKAKCEVDYRFACKPDDYFKRSAAANIPQLAFDDNGPKLECKDPNPFWKISERQSTIASKEGEARCNPFDNGKGNIDYVWTFKNLNLTRRTNVRCESKVNCEYLNPFNESICEGLEHCTQKYNGAPRCTGQNSWCSIDGDEFAQCTIGCVTKNGTWRVLRGEERIDLKQQKLKLQCKDYPTAEERQSGIVTKMVISLSVTALVVLAVIVCVVFYCRRQRQRELENEGILTRKLTRKRKKKNGNIPELKIPDSSSKRKRKRKQSSSGATHSKSAESTAVSSQPASASQPPSDATPVTAEQP